jgi:hypothetical protein
LIGDPALLREKKAGDRESFPLDCPGSITEVYSFDPGRAMTEKGMQVPSVADRVKSTGKRARKRNP